MTWLQRYRVRHFITNSIWILPSLSMLAALVAARLLLRLDAAWDLRSSVDPEAMRTLMGTLAGAMFTFVVFVCSALLIAVQLASAQLSPRIIAFVFRDPVTKACLALFVFIFTLLLAVLIRITATVPLLSAYAATYGFMICLVVFLFLVDHVGKALRPSGALRSVGSRGRRVVESVYSRRFVELPENPAGSASATPDGPCRTVVNPRDGAVLAFDIQGLCTLAERADCVIELVPQVGDYVSVGEPLFRIFGAKGELSADQLCQSVAVGQERTLEQDPTFAFRIMVDIASKGLSPAINDPTTAVLAIDQIHHLLRSVGTRCLDDERVRDASGRLRLIYRTPDWEDFVHLAATEIRHFGSESIQVARRLRAMLENLIRCLPTERAPLLQRELDLLSRSAKRSFLEPEDRALADVSDLQGVGGKHGSNESRSQTNDVAAS
jgi:uncharacterized membrane protein